MNPISEALVVRRLRRIRARRFLFVHLSFLEPYAPGNVKWNVKGVTTDGPLEGELLAQERTIRGALRAAEKRAAELYDQYGRPLYDEMGG